MSEQQDSSQEKTEEPTQKRLREAREKGQVPRSRELISFSMLVVTGIFFLFLGQTMVGDLAAILENGFQIQREELYDDFYLLERLQHAVVSALLALAPYFLTMVAVAVLSPLVLGGIAFSWEAMQFKWEKIDPIKGMKKIFSARGLMELVKALFKFVFVAALWAFLFITSWEKLVMLGRESLQTGLSEMANMVVWDFILLSSILVLIVLADVPFQIWDHVKNLKMTKQEVKDEMKDTDGKPEVKGKMRNMQREASRKRIASEVPKADVVITNPEHFSVAIRYDQEKASAPLLVAKGVDFMALHIRHVADLHQVPVITAPPLARALYYSTELDQEIPAGLYLAVAQVLAYVYQLQEGYTHSKIDLDDLPIPDELRR